MQQTKKERWGGERQRGCVGCVGRTELSDTLLMNILKGPLLCEEQEKLRHFLLYYSCSRRNQDTRTHWDLFPTRNFKSQKESFERKVSFSALCFVSHRIVLISFMSLYSSDNLTLWQVGRSPEPSHDCVTCQFMGCNVSLFVMLQGESWVDLLQDAIMHHFQLQRGSWKGTLPAEKKCVMSSVALEHLVKSEKITIVITVHYGGCRIQWFWRLTQSLNILPLCCINFDHFVLWRSFIKLLECRLTLIVSLATALWRGGKLKDIFFYQEDQTKPGRRPLTHINQHHSNGTFRILIHSSQDKVLW